MNNKKKRLRMHVRQVVDYHQKLQRNGNILLLHSLLHIIGRAACVCDPCQRLIDITTHRRRRRRSSPGGFVYIFRYNEQVNRKLCIHALKNYPPLRHVYFQIPYTMRPHRIEFYFYNKFSSLTTYHVINLLEVNFSLKKCTR